MRVPQYHTGISSSARRWAKFSGVFGSAGSSVDEILPGVYLHKATRQPCIVCGHPTGDCADHYGTGESDNDKKRIRIQFAEVETPSKDEPQVLVREDIYREVQITSMTKTRVLVAKAGTYVPRSKALDLGII